jgi:hypothetical protein
MRPSFGFVLIFCLCAVGCSGSHGPLAVTPYDPDAMADAAMAQFDHNGNGKIDGAELDRCLALKLSLAAIDSNKDKGISLDELKERFRAYQSAGVGLVAVGCTVKLNGAPIEGAVVTFIPEDCMLGRVKGGSGTTDADGSAEILGEGGTPGLAYGLYKVTVAPRPEGTSDEIPARYRTPSELGREVYPDARGGFPSIEINLKSQ